MHMFRNLLSLIIISRFIKYPLGSVIPQNKLNYV